MVMFVDLIDKWSRQVTAEIVIRLDTVEVRCREAIVGVADRELLRRWLRDPNGMYAYDEMAWMHGPMTGIALAIDDIVPPSWLPDHVVARLREAV
jgi:hypothetical protein